MARPSQPRGPASRSRPVAAARTRASRPSRPEQAPPPAPPAPAEPLTPAQTRFLRGHAHGLKSMLQVGGKGLSDAVVAEVDGALGHHELIKVKVAAGDREQRDVMIATLAERTGAALVQRIGHVAVLFRQNPEKRLIVLPRA